MSIGTNDREATTMATMHRPETRPERTGQRFAARVVPEDGGSFATVVFRGELDVGDAARADAALRWAQDATHGAVVLDLTGLSFIDVTGVHLIADAAARLDGRLTVLRGPDPVQRIFALTAGVRPFIPFAD
jgi:anti-anti-sigma factor